MSTALSYGPGRTGPRRGGIGGRPAGRELDGGRRQRPGPLARPAAVTADDSRDGDGVRARGLFGRDRAALRRGPRRPRSGGGRVRVHHGRQRRVRGRARGDRRWERTEYHAGQLRGQLRPRGEPGRAGSDAVGGGGRSEPESGRPCGPVRDRQPGTRRGVRRRLGGDAGVGVGSRPRTARQFTGYDARQRGRHRDVRRDHRRGRTRTGVGGPGVRRWGRGVRRSVPDQSCRAGHRPADGRRGRHHRRGGSGRPRRHDGGRRAPERRPRGNGSGRDHDGPDGHVARSRPDRIAPACRQARRGGGPTGGTGVGGRQSHRRGRGALPAGRRGTGVLRVRRRTDGVRDRVDGTARQADPQLEPQTGAAEPAPARGRRGPVRQRGRGAHGVLQDGLAVLRRDQGHGWRVRRGRAGRRAERPPAQGGGSRRGRPRAGDGHGHARADDPRCRTRRGGTRTQRAVRTAGGRLGTGGVGVVVRDGRELRGVVRTVAR